jgi:hypothetical protein
MMQRSRDLPAWARHSTATGVVAALLLASSPAVLLPGRLDDEPHAGLFSPSCSLRAVAVEQRRHACGGRRRWRGIWLSHAADGRGIAVPTAHILGP